LILRPKELAFVQANILFNFHGYDALEIDLNHINKDGRTSFEISQVSTIVTILIHSTELLPSFEKIFDDEKCLYYVKMGIVDRKRYKLVFCICSDKPNYIGVITLHRLKS